MLSRSCEVGKARTRLEEPAVASKKRMRPVEITDWHDMQDDIVPQGSVDTILRGKSWHMSVLQSYDRAVDLVVETLPQRR